MTTIEKQKLQTMIIKNIRQYLPSKMSNTTQIKLMGYPRFNALPKGWVKREYMLSSEELELFKLLNGVRGEKNQQIVVKKFYLRNTKEKIITIKCKNAGEVHEVVEILYNSDIEFDIK